MIKSATRWALLLTATALLLAACAAGAKPAPRHRSGSRWLLAGPVAEFDQPITFIVSLFTTNVNVYEVQNNGNWYDFGFMLGVACAFSSGGWAGTTGTRRTRKRTSG